MVVKLALALAASAAFIANAAALPATRRDEDVPLFETLEKQAVDKLNQYSLIASAAYCAPEFTASWTCGGTSSWLSICRHHIGILLISRFNVLTCGLLQKIAMTCLGSR